MLAAVAALCGCSDLGERNNPTDAMAVNYNPMLIPGAMTSVSSSSAKTPWSYMNTKVAYGEFLDSREKQIYKVVAIDSVVWFAENLNFTKSGVCYENDPSMCEKYGRLYTWSEASTACPDGFHLPTKEALASLPAVDSLLASKGWMLDNGNSGGANKYGFSLLPGGRYVSVKGGGSDTGFVDVAHAAYLWTATKTSSDSAYAIMYTSSVASWPKNSPRKDRHSVRCVGDLGTEFVAVSSSSEKASSSSVKTTSSSSSAKTSSSSSVKTSNSSSNSKRIVQSDLPCGDLWCGPELDYAVKTGFTSKSGDVGAWFYYTDDGNGGDSYFTFAAPLDSENIGYRNVIDTCGGICGQAHMGMGYEYPYLGLAFFLKADVDEMVDITSWGGICVSYTSDKDFYLALHPNETIQAEMLYDDFLVRLPKSKEGKTIDIPWKNFSQLGWGESYELDKLLTEVSSIVFSFKDMSYGTVVNFNIVSVGRYNSCTRF